MWPSYTALGVGPEYPSEDPAAGLEAAGSALKRLPASVYK